MEPLEGPAGSILECLVLDSGELVLELAAPVFYLLGALAGKQPMEGTGRKDWVLYWAFWNPLSAQISPQG